MSKVKVLSIVCVILLLSNISIVIYLFTGNGHRHHPDRNRNLIIEQLDLQEAQIVQYDSLIKIHRQEIGAAQEHIAALKSALYPLLNQAISTTQIDSFIQQINSEQKNIEYIHFHHFQDIKNICSEKQLIAFNDLTKELAKLFMPPPPPPNK